jgi:Uma2 family endonuclease
MSYEQFLDWLGDSVHAEWVDGEVVMMAPGGEAHVRLHLFLLRLIGEYLDYRPLGEIRFDPFNMKTSPDLTRASSGHRLRQQQEREAIQENPSSRSRRHGR